jgi:hypothetical protein
MMYNHIPLAYPAGDRQTFVSRPRRPSRDTPTDMARSIRNGTIMFGLTTVPVKAHS